MRFISHKSMKFHVLKISQSLTTVKKMEYFSKRLLVWINACVIEKWNITNRMVILSVCQRLLLFVMLNGSGNTCDSMEYWLHQCHVINGKKIIREKKKDNTLVYLIHQKC